MVEPAASVEVDYSIPFEFKKLFKIEDQNEMKTAFQSYDTDKNGVMDAGEFK